MLAARYDDDDDDQSIVDFGCYVAHIVILSMLDKSIVAIMSDFLLVSHNSSFV